MARTRKSARIESRAQNPQQTPASANRPNLIPLGKSTPVTRPQTHVEKTVMFIKANEPLHLNQSAVGTYPNNIEPNKDPSEYWNNLGAHAGAPTHEPNTSQANHWDFTADEYSSYGSFSQQGQPMSMVQQVPTRVPSLMEVAPVSQVRQVYVESAPQVQTGFYEVVVSPTNFMTFYGSNHFLSTMYMCPLRIDENDYGSVEHYYQATKLFALCGPHEAGFVATIQLPQHLKARVRRLLASKHISRKAVDKWRMTQGLMILLYATRQKFAHNAKLLERLIGTGNQLLVQAFDGDDFMASGMNSVDFEKWAQAHKDEVLKFPNEISPEGVAAFPTVGKGKNMLGAICMKVRNEIVANLGINIGQS